MCISPIFIPEREQGLGLSSDKGKILSGSVSLIDYDNKFYKFTGSKVNPMSLGVYVPCGKCPECLKSRQRQWYARFELEKQYWSKRRCFTYFCTFTYDNENIPSTREKAVLDIQALIKNISRKFGFKPRFYVTSEFGTEHNRLHYHALIFNIPYVVSTDTIDGLLRKSWHRGFISVKVAGGKEFDYISKYVTKDIEGYSGSFKSIQMFSKRPMLGLPAGSDRQLSQYLNSRDNNCLHFRGFDYPVPRALRTKLINDDVASRRLADFKLKRGIKHDHSETYIKDVIDEYNRKKKAMLIRNV